MRKTQQSPYPRYVVIGTEIRGGMRSVVRSYEEVGFHKNADYRFIASHVEGSAARRLWQATKATGQLLYALTIRRCDFVHAHVAMKGSFWRKSLFAFLTLAMGRRFILHLHGSEFRGFYEGLPRPGQFLVRFTLAKSTRVIVLSEYWKRFVEDLGCRNAVVISNWVADKHGTHAISEQRGDVLFLGEVGLRKGVFDLIRAYRALADRHGQAALPTLHVAGNGQVAEARTLVETLGLRRVVNVVGWASGEALERVVATSGTFVLPSYNEGLPMAILEAMNAGMAIISTPVGGIPEVVTPENGILVSPGAVDELASALEALIFDPARRQAMAKAARRDYYQLYSPERALSAMAEVYREMLPAGGRTAPQTS